uniref:RRM domain-containing protein n=1 Tax=Chromera velia CCMP2878 TaxID=1169474 RepID=A0A0G4HKP4_9ALVE|eukprot:Cvel_28499.t1-p1 / transcript=Cvel_28499.t1 / gene=Cvel_28499 / organism=Chromera_velia_CCMP2878 / gene_product=CUGBP Elav-like family member 1, putative / transcript_product=CUGBP Elav-like family member 1, putative / location=Cvel_scaffold3742:12336-13812(+) / protein_length=299 / sequence_SO=supercontig / SO=protein_coding / is_pseudo=false
MAQNLAMPTCECELLRAHIRALEKENDCLRERLALYQKKTSPGGQEKGERLALYQKLSDPVSGRKSTTSPATIAPLPQTGTGAGLPALPPPPSAADLHKEVVVSHFRDNTVTVTGPEERVVKPKHNEPLPTDAQKELHFQSNQNGCNLFVFHIPGEWREEDLQRHFRPFGTIVSAIIARETQTGRNKGFGFVCYESPLDALKAISEMNGASVAGKRLSVQLKRTTLRKGEEDEKKAAATPAPAPPAPKGGTVTADQRGCTRILTVSPAVHSQHLQMHKQYAVPPATVDGGDGGAEKKSV